MADRLHIQTTSLPESFETFLTRFDTLFVRSEPRQHFRDYVRGLLAPVERKNCWQLAESVGLDGPQQFQRLLTKDGWDADAMCRELRQGSTVQLGDKPLIGVIDESGVVKSGQRSVGVKRQYCGRVGKVANCQVGVYLSAVSHREQALLDRELYLPEEWCADTERRTAAKVPPAVSFKTKPQLAQQMLDHAWAEGLALDWVTADTTYGNSPGFRNHIQANQRRYVLAISKTTPLQRPRSGLPATAAEIALHIPHSQWEAWSDRQAERGELWYEWARVRVVAPNDDIGEQWLLVRRFPDHPGEFAFFLSNASRNTPIPVLIQVAMARHSIEELFEAAKGQVGLDEYEVRYWHSWYRHTTLAMVALMWLTLLRQSDREKNEPTALDTFEPG